MCLSQRLLWLLHRHQLHRRHQPQCLSQPPHQAHRVFDDLAARGRTSVDWFYGFKLHLVVNDQGELLNLTLTPGNTNDRKPVPRLLINSATKEPTEEAAQSVE